MLRYLPLVWAALARHKLRTILTLLSVTAAFTLFGVTMGTDAAFQKMVDVINRSVVVIGARFADNMTDAQGQQIVRMPNVAAVSAAGAVFGYYRNPKNRAGIMMLENEAGWPNALLTPAQWAQWKTKPDGIFVSRATAAKRGLKKGDIFTYKNDGHTGLVLSAHGSSFITVEGNTGPPAGTSSPSGSVWVASHSRDASDGMYHFVGWD